jgi:hypothetical protein
MAKVFGIHLIRLHAGVNEEDFEKFVKEEIYPYALPGWKGYLLKGHYGDRAGQYLWVWEIESLEALTRYYPAQDTPSEELNQYFEAHPEIQGIVEKWYTFSPTLFGTNTMYTDYVVIE